MKRLTDKRLAIPPGQWQEVTREKARELKEIPVPSMQDLYYRLSQIEDILCDGGDEYDLDRLSLLCNQRMTMREEVSERFGWTAKIPLDRLRELVEADREGRCVVLPRLEPGHGDPVGHLGALGEPGIDPAYREFAEDVIRQFGYHGSVNGRPAYTAGGLSTLEDAFRVVGWDDPHPAPECECEEEGCHEWATGGRPTPDGYKWLCSKHYWMHEAREEAAEAALKARERNG